MTWEIIKAFAAWVGWLPITLGAIVVIWLGKLIYDREISIRDQRIEKLKDEIETSKAYQYDEIYERLTKRVKTLNQELEIATSETNANLEKVEEINQALQESYLEIRDLHNKLNSLDEQLEDLLYDVEPDYCQLCDVDDEHVMMNTISWGEASKNLVGDTALVYQEGTCLYCGSTHLKCKVCETVTGINLGSSLETFECEGGCGTIYSRLSVQLNKSVEYRIKVSRINFDSDD